jgi:signal transduction histidine kinase
MAGDHARPSGGIGDRRETERTAAARLRVPGAGRTLEGVPGWFRAAGRRPSWQRYGGGVTLIVAVVVGRLAMDPWWGRQQNRHLFFLPAVMLIAWLFGFGPGMLATVVSVLALACFWSGEGVGAAGRVPFELLSFFLVSAAVCLLVRSLQRARERADAARVSREQVLTVVAHDLRSPLATIMLSASSLARDTSDPKVVQNRVKTIDRAVGRMDSLIRDIVDAAGVERGELPMTIKPERVDTLVQEAIDQYAPLAQEAGVTLDAKLSRHESMMGCDRQRILQVLGNLIGNALKFTPSGGRITVSVEEQEATVGFSVDDTGSGIAPEHLGHLFDRYWSGDSRGIGLGLYIARSIVRGHGGDIGVRSTPGAGASFFFSVPRSASPAPEPGGAISLRHLLER